MGMIGYYVAVDDSLWQQIENGETNVYEIKSEDYPTLDIDKAWQAIFYLLCNDIDDGEPPFNYVVPLGGEMFDTDLIGAFYLDNTQVQEACLAMKDMTKEEFKAKYDFNALVEDEVYPILGGDEDSDDFFEYLYTNFKDIQEYYKQVVAKGLGVVFYIM